MNYLDDLTFNNKVTKWFKYRFHPKYQYHIVRTGDPPGYSDVVERMLQVNMRLLCDFVEREIKADIVNWDWTEHHAYVRDLCMEIYTWWNEIYVPFKKYSCSHPYYFPEGIERRTEKGNFLGISDEYADALDKWGKDQDDLEDQADDYLAKLMKVRRSLWT